MNKKIIGVLVFIISLIAILILLFSGSNKRSLSKANEYLNNGQTSKAIDIFKKLENDSKLGIEAKFGLAKSYIKMNNYNEAEKELVSVINNKPDYYEANIELYNLYKRGNRIEDAYTTVKKYYNLTKDKRVERLIDESEKEIRKTLVINVNPKGGEMHFGDYITINAPENCSIYYTMDGTNPNKNSQKYNEKIKLSKNGSITLRVMVINNKNNISNEITYKYNVKNKEIILNQELQRKFNIFMSNFAEIPYDMKFAEGKISNEQLILFGFWHNYRNHYRGIFSKGANYFEFENLHDKLKKDYIESAVKKYFNINSIKHQSIQKAYNDIYEYKNGYYYKMHGDGECPIDYSVVYKMEDIGNNQYYIYAKNYHTNEYNQKIDLDYDYYSLNFDNAEKIYKDKFDGDKIEMVRAKVKKINENGSERYILLEYK
ncbi:chitobiase/beta-hexosaminidase C-terminal domain-containing protein [Clostridium sp. KNHs214]|uniref:chitobiase/beta-hexosaminidase C-terminal domain-containing protein n=1 Tax=Clostridium sp. KNHs214 TaxID=1540257 RepID=UPI00054EB5FD|nr:chitobiase/beta-hexosaminidase C-terminal domain-containing protein [Clostridium sp. KNHs214]